MSIGLPELILLSILLAPVALVVFIVWLVTKRRE